MSAAFTPLDRKSSFGNRNNTPVNKAKTDLLSLGIDLDDDLIQRLQTNLGIERIFSVARKAASLMKDKPNVGTGGTPNIIYRNVAANSAAAHGASLSPFKNIIQMDNKHSVSVLKDLSNRSSVVEPQHRPAVDKLLETFGVMYARSPDRFVCRMLGKNYKSSDKSDSHAISKLVLKARYVNEEDFSTMIKRIDTTITPILIHSLFLLLGEDKSFAVNKKRSVIDLWGFFTLLKTVSEESRRSFDNKTSLLASDVEFWKKKNPNPSRKSVTINSQHSNSKSASTTQKSDVLYWMDDHNINEYNNLLTAENNKRFNYDANNISLSERLQSKKLHKPMNETLALNVSVASLLGTTEHKHRNDTTKGRQVMGNFCHEFENKCDVATALHSPLKSHQSPSPKGRANNFQAFKGTRISQDDNNIDRKRTSTGSTSSHQVGDLLGYHAPVNKNSIITQSINPKLQHEGIFGITNIPPRSKSVNKIHSFTLNTTNNENNSSVASVLGFTYEEGNFPKKGSKFGLNGKTPEETARLQRRHSFGRLSRDDCSQSVAAVMGSGREDNVGRGSSARRSDGCTK